MKSTLHFTFVALLIGLVGHTQPTVYLEDLTPPPGTQLVSVSSTYTIPGPGGENQTWDFSAMTTEMNYPFEYIFPDGLPEAENFPEATHVFFGNTGSPSYGYQSFENNKIEDIGFYSTSEFIEALSVYSDPKTILAFPLTYNTVFSDSFTLESINHFTFEGMTTTSTIEESGFIEAVVDGYGTLITPNNTYEDVLRVRIESDSDVLAIGGDNEPNESQHQSVQHLFVAAGVPYPLVTLSVFTVYSDGIIQNQFTSGSYLGNIVLNVGETNSPVQQINLFPVPAEDHLNLHMDLTENTVVKMTLFTIEGRIAAQWTDHTLLSGMNQTILSLPELAAGSYVLHIISEHFSESLRVIIAK